MTFITRTQHIQLQNKQTNNCATETIELALFKSQTKVTTGAKRAMRQSESLIITCNSLKARGKSRVQGAISFGFVTHWLKNCRLILSQLLSLAIAIASLLPKVMIT